jgi:predicted PurR-regulated permease PerM
MFAYMLHPMVLSLERRGWTRRHAVNTIYIVAALLTLGIGLGTFLQARTLWRDLMSDTTLVSRLDEQVQTAAAQVEAFIQRWTRGETPAAAEGEAPPQEAASDVSPLSSLVADVRAWIDSNDDASALQPGNLWALVRRMFGSLISAAVFAFLVPVYTWFLLFELERIQAFVRSYLPAADREVAGRIGAQIAEVLGNFFRGRLLVCLIKGLLLAAAMAVLGIPYAFLLGILSGLFSLIPFAGPAIGYGAAFLLALLEFEPFGAAWRVGAIFALGELVEGYVLLPYILGDKLGLHPLVVFLSLTVAGAALGMFGVLLALPLTATAIILTRELVLPLARDWAEGRRSDGAAPGGPSSA